ncbi:MAG: hypothetical protein RRC34_16700 [Lentisphaeria bacterium]|nr:hypothetical protein [Lentisphaeria bacterium]
MRSLSAFVFATIGVALVWALSAIVPFIVLAMPGLEGLITPSPREVALLACCYGAGAVFWLFLSTEMAALISRRSMVGWTALQTAGLLIALPLLGNSLPMMMILMAGLGCMNAVVWAVWFPLLLEVDYRMRPSMAAAFFVALYSAAAIGIPGAVELTTFLGPLRALLAFGGMSMIAALLVIGASKSILRPSRVTAPTSFFRFGKAELSRLFNLSFIFLCLIILPTFTWVLQALEQGVLSIGLAEKFRIDQSGLLWIAGIARAPALAVLLLTMPTIRHGVPLRYFGLGLLISGGALPVLVNTANSFVFTGAYMVCFAGVGLCWGAFFAAISAAVPRETRFAALLVAALALVTGALAASGWQWVADFLDLETEFVFATTAIGVSGVGLTGLLASFFASLNGVNQGGHSEEDHQTSQTNFRKFTYGNPQS